jgi:hypothetical protein
MDTNHNISLTDIGLVVEKLMGSGYISEYSTKDFKHKYLKYLYRIVNIFSAYTRLKKSNQLKS